MKTTDRIFVAGHLGLVGSALIRVLNKKGYRNLITRTKAEVDLRDRGQVERLFEEEHPDYVFLAAAKVGGINANSSYPAEFIYDNIAIAANIVDQAYRSKVEKLLFLGSSCIYPKDAPQPIREEYLLSGYLEKTNEPYAVAKIAGIVLCQSYNRQYGTRFISVMPTNLYGIEDNFDLDTSHVFPALIRKFVEAKRTGQERVVVWGTGNPRREFLHADDLADACEFLMNNYEDSAVVNIGTGLDCTIKELAESIAEKVDYRGNICFDPSRPDGTMRKVLDVDKLHRLGWHHSIELDEGISGVVSMYRENH